MLNAKVLIAGVALLGIGTGGMITYNIVYNSSTTVVHEETKNEAAVNQRGRKDADEKKNQASEQLRSGKFEKTPDDGKRLFHEFMDDEESERLKNKADERMKKWKERLNANRKEAGLPPVP